MQFSGFPKIGSVIFLILILVTILSSFLLPQKAAFAQLDELRETANTAGLGEETSIAKIVGRIISIVLSLMSIFLIIMIIIGGFMWMTSGGNAEQVTKAKDIMKNALIGLIIIIFAYALAEFIIKRFSDVTAK